MNFLIEVRPNEQAIQLVDEMMKSYITVYDLPHQRELSFVLHELIINAVEAMTNIGKEDALIQVRVVYENGTLTMSVIDQADGIPEEEWEQVLTYDFETMGDSDRGRGLFFVQHMVDRIWFEHVAPSRFLVGVSKNIVGK